MKSCFFLFCLCVLCAVGATGQTYGAVLSAQPQVFTIADHPQHAFQTPLAPDQDLREQSSITSARGERPLWEFMPPPPFVPIADIARVIRNEHALARKAVKVLNN